MKFRIATNYLGNSCYIIGILIAVYMKWELRYFYIVLLPLLVLRSMIKSVMERIVSNIFYIHLNRHYMPIYITSQIMALRISTSCQCLYKLQRYKQRTQNLYLMPIGCHIDKD